MSKNPSSFNLGAAIRRTVAQREARAMAELRQAGQPAPAAKADDEAEAPPADFNARLRQRWTERQGQ